MSKEENKIQDKTFTINVEGQEESINVTLPLDHTIDDLRDAACEMAGVENHNIRLKKHATKLEQIEDENTIDLISDKAQKGEFFKLDLRNMMSMTFDIDVNGTELVKDIMTEISRQLHLNENPNRMDKLVFEGKGLDFERTLAEQGVVDERCIVYYVSITWGG